MKKNIALGLAAIFVLLGGFLFYFGTRPLPAKAPGTTSSPVASSGAYSEHAKYYDITAQYASSTPLAASANTAALALMQGFVGATIAQFKTAGNFANLTPADVSMIDGRMETLDIVYLIASSPHTISYIFTIYEDMLGAHGNTSFHTFTFDTRSGAPLSLADVFTPGTPYLDTLSLISRARLPGVIGTSADMSFIKPGTAPLAQNFEDFFFDNKDFVILFAPYHVAPYVAGPQTLRIPISELASILKSEYR